MKNIYKINEKNINIAKNFINEWKIIAIPTETVYWLWVDATNEEAVRNLFLIKNRPFTNPMNILLADKKNINKYAIIQNEIEEKIIEKYMPWPITLILKKKENISNLITAWNKNIWIRIPDFQSAKKILTWIKKPLVVTSANINWKKPAITPLKVYKYFWNNIPVIFDWWKSIKKIPSTICEIIDGKIKIWRQWPLLINF